MRLEAVAKYHSPKSPMMSDSPRATASDSLNGTDVMAAMGMAQSQAGFGMAAFCGKHELSQNDKQRAINLLLQFAYRVSGKYRGVAKLEGHVKAKVLQSLATFAYADYCRSAATPGARCKDCHGTGRAIDLAKTELWGRPVEKECGRCKGGGYSRLPASAAYRAVLLYVPDLTQPTWSRTIKPLYDALISQCHKEESLADSVLSHVTR
ncbi:antitermination protein [Atlantibacter hermannii]|uniref:antitermination protein n=1 Tax=Atlantibacter hermannii TaxID=565 RepID=UPI0028B11A5A|nr:antitermination protein [Atlantibacter hermannii]